MEDENPFRENRLLYWFFVAFGAILVLFSFMIRIGYPNSIWVDLLINIGATLIATPVLAFLYQRFGSQNLLHQIAEMRRSLIITQRGLELGIRNMWPERRRILNNMWNTFTAAAQSEVWLFGVAELGFAEDEDFHRIVSDGTARGCHYRFLLLDPSSDAAEEIDNKEGGVRQVQGRIRSALRQFQAVQKQNAGKRGIIEIRLYASIPHVSIVRSDDELLLTQYMWPLVGNSCFTYHVQNVTGGIFPQYAKYFETIWENAHPITVLTEQGQDEQDAVDNTKTRN